MAITNHERVGKALDLLKAGLAPFVEREIKGALESRKLDAHQLCGYGEDRVLGNKPVPEQDVAGLLKLMWDTWHDRPNTLGRAGMATGRQEGVRAGCGRRRKGDESRRCTAGTLQ